MVEQSANLSMSRYFRMSENYLAEQEFENFKTSVGKVKNFGSAVIAGAILGNVPGAVVGAAAFAVTEAISYKGRMSNYYSALNATKYGTEFGAERAGLYDGGKGTEN